MRLCPSVRTQITPFDRNTIATQSRYVIALISSERVLSPCSVRDEPTPVSVYLGLPWLSEKSSASNSPDASDIRTQERLSWGGYGVPNF